MESTGSVVRFHDVEPTPVEIFGNLQTLGGVVIDDQNVESGRHCMLLSPVLNILHG
jgi:hypothetical protein